MEKPSRPLTAELLAEIGKAFNSRDTDRIMSHFADDCTFFMASGPEPVVAHGVPV